VGRASFETFPSLGSPFQVPTGLFRFVVFGVFLFSWIWVRLRVLDVTVSEGFKGAEMMRAAAFEDG
jgi:hypothetical protein